MKKQSRRQNHRSDDDTVAENVLEDSSAPAEPEGEHVMSDVEIETLIQQREAELRANPKGLDISSTLVKHAKPGEPPELKKVPCIGKYWINDIEKKPYVLPTEFKMPNFGKNRSGEVDYYKKHFKNYNETFHNLVTLQFKFFWSTIIYNSRILPLIHSFLDVFPKPWSRTNTVFSDDADVRELSDEFLALIKQTLIRLTTRSESASIFLTPAGYTQILSAHHVFPARCVVSACAQYGASDPEFCTAIRSLIDDYENIATESLTAGKDILRDFETSDVASALCAQLMHSDLKCVLDAAASIACVLRVCPAVVDVFYKSKLLVTVQEVYNTVADVEDDRVEHILKCLIACAAHVVNGMFIAKLREWYRKMDPKDRSNSYDALIGELIDVITQWNTVPSKRFLCDFAKSTHLGKRVSRLANEFPNTIYIGKIVDVHTILLPYEEEAESEKASIKETEPANSSKIEPLIAQICDIIGDIDKDILKKALLDNGLNAEVVIDKILNGEISLAQPSQSQSTTTTSTNASVIQKEERKEEKSEVVVKISDKKKTAEELENENFGEQMELKESIFTRLERMEEEEELEQIHRYERSRLRKTESSSLYDDEYDDSYDEFINYDFQQDGERFNDNQMEETNSSVEPSSSSSSSFQSLPPPTTTNKTPATTEAKPQRKPRQQSGQRRRR